MKFLLAKKLSMTQIFKDGKVIPVTVLEAGPCLITQLKTKEKDGYQAVQLAFGKKNKVAKPLKGIFKDKGNFRWIREFRVPDLDNFKVGEFLKVDIFKVGEKVNVSSLTKGRGFQGVVKRHGFSGGPRSHGHKDTQRSPGAIGATTPQRVLKGTKMAGRMGPKRVTVKNLEIVDLDADQNLLVVKGAIPGHRNTLVEIRSNQLTNKGKLIEKKNKEND